MVFVNCARNTQEFQTIGNLAYRNAAIQKRFSGMVNANDVDFTEQLHMMEEHVNKQNVGKEKK